MAKKRGPKPGPLTESVGVRLPVALVSALDEAVRKNRRTRTLEVQIALESYLASLGLWPRDGEAK